MFQSDFLDLFSRTHWSVVPIIFLPITSLMLWYSAVRVDAGWLLSLAIAVAGFIGWTLTEYWLHRLFFHWQPPGALGERMHFLVHGVHHEWPSDKYRLVMPPAVSISLYFIFLGIFYALFSLLNCTSYVWAWHAGFVVGYVFYDCVHYWLHHHTPKSAYWVKLKKNHMIHHFKDHDSRFCVSNMFWDKIFGTAGE
ncbi:MAG: sterol desaturase family protein [Polyangiaceae bacterium]|nr:sterol desaturase family protein [Polyangiaceae bacterium]